MIFVHIVFSIDAPFEWLEAKWTAGDLLTYVSTIALALLAVWQNYKMDEENDITQQRLEKLASQANELSVISKIIEIESERLSRLKDAFDKFLALCDLATISEKLLSINQQISATDDELAIKARREVIKATFLKEIDDCCFHLVREIRNAHIVEDEAKVAVVTYYDLTKQLANVITENPQNIDQILPKTVTIAKNELIKIRERIIKAKEESLDKALYENLTLQEIRNLFQKNEKKEHEIRGN